MLDANNLTHMPQLSFETGSHFELGVCCNGLIWLGWSCLWGMMCPGGLSHLSEAKALWLYCWGWEKVIIIALTWSGLWPSKRNTLLRLAPARRCALTVTNRAQPTNIYLELWLWGMIGPRSSEPLIWCCHVGVLRQESGHKSCDMLWAGLSASNWNMETY